MSEMETAAAKLKAATSKIKKATDRRKVHEVLAVILTEREESEARVALAQNVRAHAELEEAAGEAQKDKRDELKALQKACVVLAEANAGEALAAKLLVAARCSTELDRMKTANKAKLAALAANIELKTQLVSTGVDYRLVECELLLDYVQKQATKTRLDTGIVIEERALRDAELQMALKQEARG